MENKEGIVQPLGAGHIIAALDMNLDAALAYVNLTKDKGILYKVGMQLYNEMFMSILSKANQSDDTGTFEIAAKVNEFLNLTKGKIFLDLKLVDIPQSMVGALKAILAVINPLFFNIMAVAGPKSISGVATIKGKSGLIIVTFLTSNSNDDCQTIHHGNTNDIVPELAFMGSENGADGIVCSTLELPVLMENCYDGIIIVPGIKTEEELKNSEVSPDQQRVGTPKGAILGGATYIVVGRALMTPPDDAAKLKALDYFISECESADAQLAEEGGE